MPSGTGSADGGPVRAARGRGDHAGPRFDLRVDDDGYAWWYLDGISDDGRYGVTVIGFIGSVFSPYYRWAGRKHPENHISMNCALYGPKGRWCMTERGAESLTRDETHFAVGPSSMEWDGTSLTVKIDERSVPHLSRVRGTIHIHPQVVTGVEVALHKSHMWRPFAPAARIEVDFPSPGVKWSGHGYLDGNFGTSALERDFKYWTWGRFPIGEGAQTFYDVTDRKGQDLNVALRFGPDGSVREVPAPPKTPLSKTLWQVARETRSEKTARELARYEDAPFYARAAVETVIDGEKRAGVHEALDCDRFAANWVHMLLPWRMPRAKGPFGLVF
jgi:carotenoid 1,2-hydratase